MNPDLEDWLLSSPLLESISTLALDASALGLLDLRSAITEAVSFEACRQAIRGNPRPERVRAAARLRRRPGRRALRLRLHAGAALLHGELSDGICISQGPDTATLHLNPGVPHAVAAALPGRPLAALLSHPLLDARRYVMWSALSWDFGAEVAFQVPAVPLPRGSVAAPRFSLSSWAPAGRDPGPPL